MNLGRINFRDGNKIASSGTSGLYQYVNGVWSQLGAGGDSSHTGGSSGSFIGGGVSNTVDGSSNWSFIGGGLGNGVVDSVGGAICAGGQNLLSGSAWSVMVGGYSCGIGATGVDAEFNFIGGGYFNLLLGQVKYSSIVGGTANGVIDSNSSIIVNGESNIISGSDAAFIGGGASNSATFSDVGFVGGGTFNATYGYASSVVGGQGNMASGSYSVILGGVNNVIQAYDGECNSILGGKEVVVATGVGYAIGGGRRANINHSGASVLTDGQDRDHNSRGVHTMNLDYASGVYLTLPRFTGASNQTGNYGETKFSGTYLYVCTGTAGSGWGRVQLATF